MPSLRVSSLESYPAGSTFSKEIRYDTPSRVSSVRMFSFRAQVKFRPECPVRSGAMHPPTYTGRACVHARVLTPGSAGSRRASLSLLLNLAFYFFQAETINEYPQIAMLCLCNTCFPAYHDMKAYSSELSSLCGEERNQCLVPL